MESKIINPLKVLLSNLPSEYTDFGKFTNIKNISKKGIENLNNLLDIDFNLKNRNLKFNVKRVLIYGCISIVGIFYFLSFLAILDIINSPELKSYFSFSISILISSLISFLLGYNYPK